MDLDFCQDLKRVVYGGGWSDSSYDLARTTV